MTLRSLLATGLCTLAVLPAGAQSLVPAPDNAAMERALQQADGPRKRILEAARAKGAKPDAPVPAAAAAASVTPAPAPRARAEAAAPAPVRPPEPLLGRLGDAPQALPVPAAAAVSGVAAVAPPEPLAAAPSLIDLPAAPAANLPPLRLVARVDPDLPARLFRRGTARVEVLVDLTVNPDGSVGAVVVREGATSAMEEAIIEALRQWRYEPQPVARRHAVRLVITPA